MNFPMIHVPAILLSMALCSSAQTTGPFEIRLADGSGPHEGRLEVLYQGDWGMVTDTGWGVVEAGVVCRQLGYHGSFPAAVGLRFPVGLTKSVLDKVKCQGNESRLAECANLGWNGCSSSCTSDKEVGVRCIKGPMPAPPYQFRLALGLSPMEGLVEVAYNEEWGPLCAAGFSHSSAVTVCRQLGFGPPKHLQALSAPDEEGYRDKLILSSVCSGGEASLLDCQLNTELDGSCQESLIAAYVSCNSPTDPYPLALDSATNTQREGTVLIYAGGQFGAVCSTDSWNLPAANVVCKQLGYGTAAEVRGNSRYGPVSDALPIHLSSVRCGGAESLLAECSHGRFGEAANCSRQQLASVVCHGQPLKDYSLRIAGGDAYRGTLEVAYSGRWMAICPADWDIAAAGVACRQMGLGKALSADAAYPETVRTGLWSQIACAGGEETLQQCNTSAVGQYQCPDGVLAMVACSPPSGGPSQQKPAEIRLAGGILPYEGAIQVRKNGTWLAVCNTSWDATEDAAVACRELGYHGAANSLSLDLSGPSGAAYMNEVACKGTESALTACRHSHLPRGAGCPNGTGLAGALCNPFNSSAQPTGVTPLRLVGGERPGEGRLEVFFYDSWGAICGGSAWTLASANVACRQLGYESATGMNSRGLQPDTPKRSLLDGVDCTGTELMLSACSHGEWNEDQCPANDVATVVCKSAYGAKKSVSPRIALVCLVFIVLLALVLLVRRALKRGCWCCGKRRRLRANAVQVPPSPPDGDGTGSSGTSEKVETTIEEFPHQGSSTV